MTNLFPPLLLLLLLLLLAAATASAWEGWEKRAAVPRDEPVSFAVAVRLRGMDELRRRLYEVSDPASPLYGRHMSKAEVDALTANPEGVRAVTEWLLAGGVPRSAVREAGGVVRVTAPAGRAGELLGGAVFREALHRGTNTTRVTAPGARVPAALEAHVDFVSAGAAPEALVPRGGQSPPPIPAGYQDPARLAQTYGFEAGGKVASSESTVCVYASLNQGVSEADVESFQEAMSLPRTRVTRVVGGRDCGSSGNCGEAALDVQYALAVASGAPATFWRIRPDQTFTDYVVAVAADPSPPLVHSISYSNVERLGDPAVQRRFDDEVAKLGARGVTVVVASGDDGAAGYLARNDPSKCSYDPYFPAVSPHALAVGGTCGPESGSAEVALSSEQGCVCTSGGGFSNHFARPQYQLDAVDSYLASASPAAGYNASGRGFPDLSAAAFNYVIVQNLAETATSGTSAATPVVAGMLALVNGERLAAGKPPLGFVQPALYSLAGTAAFNDVTRGRNNCVSAAGGSLCCDEGFETAAGWDPVTGLGSPNYSALKDALMNM